MTTSAANIRSSLLPNSVPAAGQTLWQKPETKQPVAPLILMAVVLLLVATPAALAGDGGSMNPITLMKQIAQSTYELTGLMAQSNKSMASIDEHSSYLAASQKELEGISKSSAGMASTTVKINDTLDQIAGTVSQQKGKLVAVDKKLSKKASNMGVISKNMQGSLAATKAIVASFSTIETSMKSMDSNLEKAIAAMGTSGPLTKEFAQNKTRLSIVGGDAKKYGVPNYAPDTKVMSIVLPMIKTMQEGGALPARKDSHTASNPLVGFLLGRQVPDGTNVTATVIPYDGFYGLPGPDFFVNNRIHGF